MNQKIYLLTFWNRKFVKVGHGFDPSARMRTIVNGFKPMYDVRASLLWQSPDLPGWKRWQCMRLEFYIRRMLSTEFPGLECGAGKEWIHFVKRPTNDELKKACKIFYEEFFSEVIGDIDPEQYWRFVPDTAYGKVQF